MPRQRVELPPSEPMAEAAPAVPSSVHTWVPSGCIMSDLVLGGIAGAQNGGAYPLGRVVNFVGDRSSGKTLLAIEALANFVAVVGSAKHAKYVDAESAFDQDYGEVLGMPPDVQTHPQGMDTVEEFYNDLKAFLAGIPKGAPSMYILDSLDALSDAAEMNREFGDASFGASKAKDMSKLFRMLVTDIEQSNCLLIIISQVRDKIGVTFGPKKTRSGGRALDFFASQIIWLEEKAKLTRTTLGVDRVYGIVTRIRTSKNKVALGFRDCELTIIFNYGIDDEISMLRWLKDVKADKLLRRPLDEIEKDIVSARKNRERDILSDIRGELTTAVLEHWGRIEDRIAPPMRKYDR